MSKDPVLYLKQRGSIWYYNHSVPHTNADSTRRTICFSLQTPDKGLASRMAGWLSLKTEHLIRVVKMGVKLTFEQIDELVKNHFERLLLDISQEASYAQNRFVNHLTKTDVLVDANKILREEEETVQLLTEAIKRGFHDAAIKSIAETLLRWKGYPSCPSDQYHDYLCRMILRAQREASRMKVGILRGDPIEASIQDPFFKDCVDFSQRDDLEYYLYNQNIPYHESPDNHTKTLREYINEYCEKRARGQEASENTLEEERQILDFASEILNPESSLPSITKDHTRELYNVVTRYPRHFKKRFNGQAAQDVIRSGKPYELMTIGRQKFYWQKIRAFFEWCESMGYLNENPMIQPQFKEPRTQSNKIKKGTSLSPEHLKLLFNSPLFSGFKPLDKRHSSRHEPGKMLLKDAYYWLPLLALYSGARLSELLQLTHNDLKNEDGIDYISINGDDGKRIKNPSSVRNIPLHPDLVARGFLTFTQELLDNHQSAEKRIFSQITMPIKKPHNEASKWYQRYFKNIGLKDLDPRYKFHSLRHNFEDAAREVMPEDMRLAIQGRSETSSAKHYGRGYTAKTLYPHLCKIKYAI